MSFCKWCIVASTIITAPSTIIPKSIAPKLIKFPLTPKWFIKITAKSIESGITDATINPARRLPRNSINTNITINAPSKRFLVTVPIALSTNLPLSMNASATTPSGKVLLICAIFSFTLSTTALEFSPFNIKAKPQTISPLPSLVEAPYLNAIPSRTVATSRTKTGAPFLFLTTTFSKSLMPVAIPTPRIK